MWTNSKTVRTPTKVCQRLRQCFRPNLATNVPGSRQCSRWTRPKFKLTTLPGLFQLVFCLNSKYHNNHNFKQNHLCSCTWYKYRIHASPISPVSYYSLANPGGRTLNPERSEPKCRLAPQTKLWSIFIPHRIELKSLVGSERESECRKVIVFHKPCYKLSI